MSYIDDVDEQAYNRGVEDCKIRMMKFSDWYGNYCWEFAREDAIPDMTLGVAFSYWETKVEGKL